METQAAATFELPLHNDEKIGNKDTKRSVLLHVCVQVKHEATGLMQQSSSSSSRVGVMHLQLKNHQT